jgi:hypothetical protein
MSSLLSQLRKDYLEDRYPEKFKELEEAGELQRHCEAKANEAYDMKRSLMASGFRDYEADEIVRAELCK